MDETRTTGSQAKSIAAVLSTVFWCLFAHGYRFANNMFTHDSLLQIYQDDSAWQIALGRIFQPVLLFLRGGLCNPWLICFCALIWYCLTVCLLVDLLKIRSTVSIVILSGIVVSNLTVTVANASFLPWVDFFACSLFLSCLGVWLWTKEKGIPRGGALLCMVGVLGIYQAYICVTICLFLILLIQDLQRSMAFKTFSMKAIKAAGILVVAAACYFIIWKGFLALFGIWTADTYNGMASVGDYSGTSVGTLLLLTYRHVFQFFWNPDTFVTMMFKGISLSVVWKYILRLSNVMVMLALLYERFQANKRNRTAWWQWSLQIILLSLFPLGMNFTCFISKGMVHSLMTYAFIMPYIFLIAMVGQKQEQADKRWKQVITWGCVLSIIWSGTVYANQVYLKKSLQEQSAQSLMTRIVADIEDMESYVPGETPVAFVGSFENSPYMEQTLKGFGEIVPYGTGNTALTYVGTDYALLQFEWNVQMNLTRVDSDTKEIRQMPTYPNKGSIGYVDDVLIVKISE